MTVEELEHYRCERRWRDYRPSAAELRQAPCKWGIGLERDGCMIMGCPRHNPASSWYWVRFAEAQEKAQENLGSLSAESRYEDGQWQTVVDGQVIYSSDSETAAHWLANGAIKLSAYGGVLTYRDKYGITTGIHWLEPDDDLYADYYREYMGLVRPPAEGRLRLSTLAEWAA